MKHLPKHLRPRWRYLVVTIETWPTAELDTATIEQALAEATRGLLGDIAAADIAMRVITVEYATGAGTAVIRVRRGEVDRARAAIASLDRIDGTPVGLRVNGVSGTIRAAEEKYMNAPTRPAGEERVVFEGAAHRAVPRGDGRYDLHDADGFTGATQLDLE